jgi:hypothetical protein
MTSGPIRFNDQSYAETGAARPGADGAVLRGRRVRLRVVRRSVRWLPGEHRPPGRQALAANSASTPQRELPRLSRIARVQLLSTQVTGA